MILAAELSNFGKNSSYGLADRFNGYSAMHINRIADGYIFLRESGRHEASKYLVRTGIEVLLRIQAIAKKPELLAQIAYNEFLEDKKWLNAAYKGDLAKALADTEKEWDDLKTAYAKEFPNQAIVEKKLSLRSIAESTDLEPYYDSHFRLYSRYTHAALEAASGRLAGFAKQDNRTMAYCVLVALGAILPSGGDTTQLENLMDKLKSLPT